MKGGISLYAHEADFSAVAFNRALGTLSATLSGRQRGTRGNPTRQCFPPAYRTSSFPLVLDSLSQT